MAGSAKRNNFKNSKTQKIDSEYDLTKSLKRVSQYKPNRGTFPTNDTTKLNSNNKNERNLNNQSEKFFNSTTEPARDLYFRLEDQMSNFNDKNEIAHDALRNAFDTKFSDLRAEVTDIRNSLTDKVTNSSFRWIMGGIISAVIMIVLIWVFLSYTPLIEKNESHSESIHELDKRVNAIEKNTTQNGS